MDEEHLANSGKQAEASRLVIEGRITLSQPVEGCLGLAAALTLAHGLRLALRGSSERILGYHNAKRCSPLLCMACSNLLRQSRTICKGLLRKLHNCSVQLMI